MTDYDKLIRGLDYTAFEHVKDFEKQIEQKGIQFPEIEVGHHYEEQTPVVDVTAYSPEFAEQGYHSDSYELENVTRQEFEEAMYEIWEDAFMELDQSPP